MKLIDADKLIEEMSEKHRPNFHEDLKAYHMWIMWYWALKEAPTIDAVSVVRCKECKHWQKSRERAVMCCLREVPNRPMQADDYCSYGERKEKCNE